MPTSPAAAWSAGIPLMVEFGSAPRSSRNRANASCALTIANGSTDVPSALGWLTSTPAARSASAVATSPFRAANMSGVKPFTVERCGSAPASSRSRTIPGCASATAHMRALLRVSRVAAFTSAPCPMSVRTTSALPVRAAVISGVRPLARAAFTFAPASTRRRTIGRLAFSAARSSGVTP